MKTVDKYENYRAGLLAGGVSEADADIAIADMKADDAKIDASVCPKCGSKLTRTEDPRQSGPTEFGGTWFNYRCTAKCGWFGDRCESKGEN